MNLLGDLTITPDGSWAISFWPTPSTDGSRVKGTWAGVDE